MKSFGQSKVLKRDFAIKGDKVTFSANILFTYTVDVVPGDSLNPDELIDLEKPEVYELIRYQFNDLELKEMDLSVVKIDAS